MRPEEFTEPIHCVHTKFHMPGDLVSDPDQHTLNFLAVGIAIIVLLQVLLPLETLPTIPLFAM
jgi:hypothetical protein